MRCFHVVLFGSLLAGCGPRGDGGGVPDSAAGSSRSGPDPVVVRVPLRGGVVRAFAFASLDSAMWRAGDRVPPAARLLGFDRENGVLAIADSAGTPGWIDLRLGTVRRAAKAPYRSLVSADGWAVFGATDKNAIVRLTPTGDWQLALKRNVRRLLPSTNGALLALVDVGDETLVLRLRPPDDAVSDSTTLPRVTRAILAPLGDRAWIGSGRHVYSVVPDDMEQRERFAASGEIIALASTPSGDRVFVASAGRPQLELVDRYGNDIRQSVILPGPVAELRMDPLGRLLLARPETGDSVWVVSVSGEAVVATLPTRWREDLPTIALDGTVATLVEADVRFVDPLAATRGRTVKGGAAELWLFARWNGFRPRARGIDEPVSFSYERGADSIAVPPGDVVPLPRPDADTTIARPVTPPASVQPVEPPAPRARRWVVSFAAVLSLERAREIAATISVDGARPRIATGETGGTTVYRVVLGPYDSREAAERVGRASRHSYWIFEDVP